MSPSDMQAELARLHQVNLTVGTESFDPGDYPVAIGVDMRNGKFLSEQFICWDTCPDVGMVFLLYRFVDGVEACHSAGGVPLISPDPIPGEYWGCRPVVDWLDASAREPG